MAELYVDLILSVPNASMLGVRPYQHFFVPVNLSEYRFAVPERDVPVVVHAPSDKGVKGTDKILSALQQLSSEGLRFDLRVLHGVPHQKALSELTEADIAVDQLNLPLHGMFGIEAMASGCALATCNREDYEPFPPNRPIWHIDATDIRIQLKHLLTDKELRVRLGREGREYVTRYHDHVQVARRMLDALEATQLKFDHYPTFFAESYSLPEGEVIPEYLKRITAKIVQRWGLPEGVNPEHMIARGLMSEAGLIHSRPIPRRNPPGLESV